VRDIEFRIPVQVSILSERRVYRPYGMAGGEDGQCGLNLWARRVRKPSWERSLRRLQKQQQQRQFNNSNNNNQGEDQSKRQENNNNDDDDDEAEYEERLINLGGKNSALMAAGDRIIVCTPGGGGWGPVGKEKALGRAKALGGGGGADPTRSWKKGSHAAREETALQA
jgi:5-oxoprolinase (ATP-hydrolysing)